MTYRDTSAIQAMADAVTGVKTLEILIGTPEVRPVLIILVCEFIITNLSSSIE